VPDYVVAGITDLLQAAVQTGTGRAAQIGRPVAGKTGTTSSNKDGWFIGFTPELVAGVWMGRDDSKAVAGLAGGQAPARVFDSQEALHAAFAAGELDHDVVVVVRFQGPRANGMPELHKLTPPLAVLQRRGHRVALVTDGRMSGASGTVPAAIHVCPEALDGGPLARVRDGDVIRLDAAAGRLEVLVDDADWSARTPAARAGTQAEDAARGLGRDLFTGMRRHVRSAEEGAVTWL
jgi:dihydroxyacid dehydratase/phosphogluconate dehydratase